MTETAGRAAQKKFSRAAGAVAFGVGVAVLTSWCFDIAAVKSVVPGLPTMKANTAIGFALSGASLWLLTGKQTVRKVWTARLCTAAVFLIGAVTLSEYLFGRSLGIDELLLNDDPAPVATFALGRMAPATAAGFVFFGVALWLASTKTPRAAALAQYFAFVVLAINLSALLGYAYGIEIIDYAATFSSVAVHTAATWLLISVALLFACADYGPAAMLIQSSRRLSIQVVALGLLIVVITGLSVSAVLTRQTLESLRERIFTTDRAGVGLVAEFAWRYVSAVQASLRILASDLPIVEAVASSHFARAAPELKRFVSLHGQLDGVSLIGLDGSVLATSGDEPLDRAITSADRDWFQQVVATGKPYLGVPVLSRLPGRLLAPYAVPVLDSHRGLRAILVGDISLDALSDSIAKFQTGASSGTLLIDLRGGGMILAHPERKRILARVTERNAAVGQLIRGERGMMEARDSGGQLNLVAFTPVPNLPWGVLIHEPRNVAFAPVAQAARNALGMTLFLLVTIGVVTVWFGDRITRSLRRLRDAAHAFAGGDLDARVNSTAQDEIGQVARAFDQMADSLAQRTRQLETANQELESFSYSVSHDLRAPLRHMQGFGELLKKAAGDQLSSQARHYLDTIQDSAREMATLIDELLAFSRVGRAERKIEAVDLRELVHEAVAQLGPRTQTRAIDWRIAALPEVYGDRGMLRLALVNLIDNAVKFTRTRAQGKIEIGSLEGKQGEVIVFVRDNGVGFDMRYADKLFGVFQRLHRPSEFEGTGIGLASVRRIITRHGGRVWAEGEVGRGATFYFSLPAADGSASRIS